MRIILLFCFLGSFFDAFTQERLDHFAPDFFEQQRFAHRGGYANGPENTIETILYNINNGVGAIEIDVELTKDNQLVIFHDATIERVLQTDEARSVQEMTLAEITAIPLRDESQGKQYVASFKSLIDTLTKLIPTKEIDFLLEIDFKPHGDAGIIGVDKLMEVLNEEVDNFGDGLYNYFFVSTFYPDVLKLLREKDPLVKIALGVNNTPDSSVLLARMAILLSPMFIKNSGASIIEPNMCMVTPRYVKKWHKRGVMINAYTANTACEKENLEQFDIAYTTNCPTGTCIPDISDQIGKPQKWCKGCATD
ncbi:MAG: glycerophosphodiester phosphodiesterase [Bacteroidia bacterium]